MMIGESYFLERDWKTSHNFRKVLCWNDAVRQFRSRQWQWDGTGKQLVHSWRIIFVFVMLLSDAQFDSRVEWISPRGVHKTTIGARTFVLEDNMEINLLDRFRGLQEYQQLWKAFRILVTSKNEICDLDKRVSNQRVCQFLITSRFCPTGCSDAVRPFFFPKVDAYLFGVWIIPQNGGNHRHDVVLIPRLFSAATIVSFGERSKKLVVRSASFPVRMSSSKRNTALML